MTTCAARDLALPEPFVFDVGTNIAGATGVDAFTPLLTGGSATVVRGSQGALMLVVAARSNAYPAQCKRFTVEAELTLEDGKQLGVLTHKKRPMIDGSAGTGLRYMLNVFLVLAEDRPAFGLPNSWEGKRGTLRVALSIDDGAGGKLARHEGTVSLLLKELTL